MTYKHGFSFLEAGGEKVRAEEQRRREKAACKPRLLLPFFVSPPLLGFLAVPLFLKVLGFQRRVDLELAQLPLFVELTVNCARDAVW